MLGLPLQIENALLVSLSHAHTGHERMNRTHRCIADGAHTVTEMVMFIAILVPIHRNIGPQRSKPGHNTGDVPPAQLLGFNVKKDCTLWESSLCILTERLRSARGCHRSACMQNSSA